MIRFELRLLLLFTAFFIAVVGLVLAIGMRTEHQLVDDVEKDLMNIVNTVRFSTQKLSAERGADRAALERFIGVAQQNKAIREISVVGSTEEVIASSNPKEVGQHHALSGQEIVVREQVGSQKRVPHKVHYDIRVPLFRGDHVVGLVQASLEVEDYHYLLRQWYLKNLLIAAGAMLFAFAAVFIVINRLNRPLRRLVAAADQAASGDLTVHLPPGQRDEMGKLTQSFNEMIQKLAEQQELESKLRILERRAMLVEMTSNLAHEIRNPLNLINLTADHLGGQFQPDGDERRKAFQELIQALKTEVRQLNQMVTDFLNIGRPSKIKRTRFAFMELFAEVERAVKIQLLSKEISFECSGCTELEMSADKEQMRLVILNLLLNAIQAVPRNGRIVIGVERSAGSGETVISVTDSGHGIPPEDLSNIFEPYFTKRPGGTGLGLALVRRAIEEHGGRIRASNTPEGGARFEITLPGEALSDGKSVDCR